MNEIYITSCSKYFGTKSYTDALVLFLKIVDVEEMVML